MLVASHTQISVRCKSKRLYCVSIQSDPIACPSHMLRDPGSTHMPTSFTG